MMRIRYTILGGVGGSTRAEGSLADLFVAMPYTAVWARVPPFAVARDLFRRGVVDSGMSGGCEWTSFELSRPDYEAFVEDLLTYPAAEGGWPPAFSRDSADEDNDLTWERWSLRAARCAQRRP